MDFLFVGIILGIFIEHYVVPYLDTKFEVFVVKENEKATKHQLNTQAASFDFMRQYPEAQQNNYQCDTQAIGFQYAPSLDYDEDNDCKNKIGFSK